MLRSDVVGTDYMKLIDDDDVYYYIGERLKLEGETENMGFCTKEQEGMTAEVLIATPCTKSLAGETGENKHGGDVGHWLCWKFAAVSSKGRSQARRGPSRLSRAPQSYPRSSMKSGRTRFGSCGTLFIIRQINKHAYRALPAM